MYIPEFPAGGLLDLYRQTLLFQPSAAANGARPDVHVGFHPLPDVARGGVRVIVPEDVHDPGEPVLVHDGTAARVPVLHVKFLVSAAVQENLARLFRELPEGGIKVKPVRLQDSPELTVCPCLAGFAERRETLLVDRTVPVRYDQVEIELLDLPQPVAGRAGAVRGIEREGIRRGLFIADVAHRA